MFQNPAQFIKAGKAIFTVENKDTGNRFTYKAKKCEDKDIWFVSVLSGPMEKLAEKTRPPQYPDSNPHQSHLGKIACTVCHHGHFRSKVYCLSCHPAFDMKIRGAP